MKFPRLSNPLTSIRGRARRESSQRLCPVCRTDPTHTLRPQSSAARIYPQHRTDTRMSGQAHRVHVQGLLGNGLPHEQYPQLKEPSDKDGSLNGIRIGPLRFEADGSRSIREGESALRELNPTDLTFQFRPSRGRPWPRNRSVSTSTTRAL